MADKLTFSGFGLAFEGFDLVKDAEQAVTPVEPVEPEVQYCPNCGEPWDGVYCSNCDYPPHEEPPEEPPPEEEYNE